MADDPQIVTEAELRASVGLDLAAVDVVEQAFAALASGRVVMPPVLSMELAEAHGEVDVKTAHIQGFESFAVKVSPGFFDNPKRGLPSLNGLMLLFSATTGLVEAVFLDNGYLTSLRTAAAGAVAARHLAPQDVTTAGVIGTGEQARLQVEAAHLVRPFARVLVWGRDPRKAALCAADLAARLDVEAEVTTDPAMLVKRSQLVVTTTSAQAPVLKAEWLHPELHITAIGADRSGKTEIEPAALAAAGLYVCDRVSQCAEFGELAAARKAGYFVGVTPPELGEILTGAVPGRSGPAQITICDLTGTGVQDTAIATHAARRLGKTGTVISS